jgi:hypothetical protein
MSDLVDLLDWGLESASQMCMEVSAGKLERVEGGSSGVPSVSQALVGFATEQHG